MRISIKLLAFIGLFLVNCSKLEKKDNESPVLVIEKYDNGQLQYIGYNKGGIKVGKWREFRKGELFSIVTYHDGIKHGKEISYEICTRKILEEGQYQMGKRVGLWYTFNNGELVAVLEYKNDTFEMVYHNPKFQIDSDFLPPPPPTESDCDKLYNY